MEQTPKSPARRREFKKSRYRLRCLPGFFMIFGLGVVPTAAQGLTAEIQQITTGPAHHFFGYIGHVRTIPWNRSGRYIAALETDFQDRMPRADDAARIILLDTRRLHAVRIIDRTRAWNPQQGTMLYWNPEAPETQLFFNDRDPRTGKVFCVLFDISAGSGGRRIREFRFDDTPIGHGGVAQAGGWFAGINYGRLARLRPVTGYPDSFDWTAGVNHPADDGVFKIDAHSGKKVLLASFARLADALRSTHSDIGSKALFINHTLCNRAGDRIFFFARADFADGDKRLDVPFVIHADGTNLVQLQQHIGGHPEWEEGHRMIGRSGNRQVIYDLDSQKAVETLGDPEIFPDPGGDIALSPDGRWLANGYGKGSHNLYVLFRRADGHFVRTRAFFKDNWISGDLRLDPAPRWNRDGTQILVSAIADDAARTRQLFLIRLITKKGV